MMISLPLASVGSEVGLQLSSDQKDMKRMPLGKGCSGESFFPPNRGSPLHLKLFCLNMRPRIILGILLKPEEKSMRRMAGGRDPKFLGPP